LAWFIWQDVHTFSFIFGSSFAFYISFASLISCNCWQPCLASRWIGVWNGATIML
jgi:hypothetical protein